LDESERRHWLEGLAAFDKENELVLLGCGTGAVVREARLLGIHAHGIDQMQDDDDIFKRVDLREKLDLFCKFDLVYCVEVAEHLEPQYEGEFCDTLARHTKPGGRLVFTAAPPGQGGYNHFNCQPQIYWRDRLESRGMIYNVAETERLAEIWRNTYVTLNHLARNVQVFNQP
jgi:cyclopropane fatty-acyl-phospholipid synthase-like methyltransferase